jgi:putative drug exporter of the RND superfamily
VATGTKEGAGTSGRAGARRRWLMPAVVIVGFLLAGAWLGGLGAGLSDVQRNDSAAYLPEGSEAARVLAESARITGLESTAAILVYRRPAGVTEADRTAIILRMLRINEAASHQLAFPPIGPIVSDDGQAAEVIVRFVGSDPDDIRPAVAWLRAGVADAPGLELRVAGPAAVLTDLIGVYGSIDLTLLGVSAGVILVILIVVYRSPFLPVVVLACAGIALGLANGGAYLMAEAGLVTVSGQTQGILDVLVLGAGTDYALLLVARFREELRRTDDRYAAMRTAWRASAGPVVASGATVIVALLCLAASDLPGTRGLGPVAALGIAFALTAMVLLLPAVLVLLGRVVFWPVRPRPGPGPEQHRGVWSRVADLVTRRPRLVWAAGAVVLAILAAGLVRLDPTGIPRSEAFLVRVESLVNQDVLARHFPAAAGTPATIITRADHVDPVVAAALGVARVTKATPYVDMLAAADRRRVGLPPPGPKAVDGLAQIDVTLDVPAESVAALRAVRELRAVVHAVPGAQARVGGQAANTIDVQAAAERDRAVVIPLVLLAVSVVLVLLLRAVVAAAVMIGTVVLSYLAVLGVSAVVFRDLFGFTGTDASFPLFAFVFLVALGVDYNIFLMSRIRQEAVGQDHVTAVRTGLALTGGVITSAGVVLAATFATLAVVPLVFLAQLAFAIAFGVLLDTFVVRTLLVPALTVDIGPRIWWPGRLAPYVTDRPVPT